MLLAYFISIMRFVFDYIGLFVRVLKKKKLGKICFLVFVERGSVARENIYMIFDSLIQKKLADE